MCSSDLTTTTVAPITGEAAFSANFKLFDPEGVQTQFTVRGANAEAHIAALADYRTALAAQGYAPSEPTTGTEYGEKAEEVAAYARGTTKAGQPLVWLYSSKAVLKWRLTTVYEEHIGELPFTVTGQVWPGAAAPEREEAQKKGYLTDVPPFKIVLAENGQTEDGKAKWKYARVYGAPAPAAAPMNGNGNGHAPAAATPTNDAAPKPAPAAAAAPTNGNGTGPACHKCGGPMWDNRTTKTNPKAPDYKCRDKSCDGAIWPPKNGNGASAPAAAPAKTSSNVP